MSHSLSRALIQGLTRFYPMAKRWLHSFHGGVFPAHHKSLSLSQPVRETMIPDKLILPLRQPVGQKAELLVEVGSYVKKNQLLARAAKTKNSKSGLVVPIHAPTSGIVEAIESHTLPHASGLEDISIIIKPDFKDLALENVLNVSGKTPSSPQQIKAILLNAGIIGMGGAGFPTYAKLPTISGQIKTLLINGAECEPFITCDDLLMQTRAEEIIQGAVMVANALGTPKIICGIESNKPEAIKAMQQAAKNTIARIQVVETVYPMGGEKQLIQELTGIEIAQKTHAVDSGVLMFNVSTYAAIFRAITLGEPLTSRLVTVSGFGLKAPFNTHALIGTPFETLANAAQPIKPINYPLVMGGPMMGFKVQNNQVPVIKTTNCILVNPPEDASMQMPCIRCGECMDACPMNLLPQQLFWHSQAHEFEKVEKLNVFDCIECGCCSYVCPSNIPLVQYYRHAKSEIKDLHAEQKATELAKQRHDFKLARIEREKQEREARLKAKKEAVKKQANKSETAETDSAPAKKPSAAAAAARAAAAKRAAKVKETTDSSEKTSSAIPAARRKAIEMAQKSAAAKTGSKKETTKDPRVSAKRAAAVAAARKRAQGKKEADSELSHSESGTAATEAVEVKPKTDPKEAAKQAAMAAAKRRAKAKEVATSETTETIEAKPKTDPKEAAKQAAMAAAKRRAKAKEVTTSETTEAVEEKPKTDPKEAVKQAAMAAAKRRAQAKKEVTADQIDSETETKPVESTAVTSEDKRQKAMEAAQKRAAERKAKQQENN